MHFEATEEALNNHGTLTGPRQHDERRESGRRSPATGENRILEISSPAGEAEPASRLCGLWSGEILGIGPQGRRLDIAGGESKTLAWCAPRRSLLIEYRG